MAGSLATHGSAGHWGGLRGKWHETSLVQPEKLIESVATVIVGTQYVHIHMIHMIKTNLMTRPSDWNWKILIATKMVFGNLRLLVIYQFHGWDLDEFLEKSGLLPLCLELRYNSSNLVPISTQPPALFRVLLGKTTGPALLPTKMMVASGKAPAQMSVTILPQLFKAPLNPSQCGTHKNRETMSLGTETDPNRSWNLFKMPKQNPYHCSDLPFQSVKSPSLHNRLHALPPPRANGGSCIGGNRKGMGNSLPENRNGSQGKGTEDYGRWVCCLKLPLCFRSWILRV